MIKWVKKNNITGMKRQWLQTKHTPGSRCSSLTSLLSSPCLYVSPPASTDELNSLPIRKTTSNTLWSKCTTWRSSSLTSRMLTTHRHGDRDERPHQSSLRPRTCPWKGQALPARPPDAPSGRWRPSPRPASPNRRCSRGSPALEAGRDGKPILWGKRLPSQ